jgi:dihydrofolate synthase/folylpolyglutamate synthase
MDHREFLGDSLEGIAGEKAGIIKRGAPVVGPPGRGAEAVIEACAAALGAPLTLMGRDFDAWSERGGLTFQGEEPVLDLPAPALAGPHQVDNAGVAVAAALALGLPEAAIAEGLRTATWPGRMQRLTAGPYAEAAKAVDADLLLDGGHNPHAARALARALEDLTARDGRSVALVVGMLGNKDAAGFFDAFGTLRPKVFTTGFAADAAASAAVLAEGGRDAGLETQACTDVGAALDAALAAGAKRVVICGSLYMAGEVLAAAEATWPT